MASFQELNNPPKTNNFGNENDLERDPETLCDQINHSSSSSLSFSILPTSHPGPPPNSFPRISPNTMNPPPPPPPPRPINPPVFGRPLAPIGPRPPPGALPSALLSKVPLVPSSTRQDFGPMRAPQAPPQVTTSGGFQTMGMQHPQGPGLQVPYPAPPVPQFGPPNVVARQGGQVRSGYSNGFPVQGMQPPWQVSSFFSLIVWGVLASISYLFISLDHVYQMGSTKDFSLDYICDGSHLFHMTHVFRRRSENDASTPLMVLLI